jgi:hypothetical protein
MRNENTLPAAIVRAKPVESFLEARVIPALGLECRRDFHAALVPLKLRGLPGHEARHDGPRFHNRGPNIEGGIPIPHSQPELPDLEVRPQGTPGIVKSRAI